VPKSKSSLLTLALAVVVVLIGSVLFFKLSGAGGNKLSPILQTFNNHSNDEIERMKVDRLLCSQDSDCTFTSLCVVKDLLANHAVIHNKYYQLTENDNMFLNKESACFYINVSISCVNNKCVAKKKPKPPITKINYEDDIKYFRDVVED